MTTPDDRSEFQSLAENLPDNIARWDLLGRYTYINSVHEQTLATPSSQVVGKTIRQAFPDGRFAQAAAAVERVLATGEAVRSVRQSIPIGDGRVQIHDIHLVPERDSSGVLTGVLGIGRDTTELYRLESSLRASEQELRALAEASPGMMGCFHRRADGSLCMPYVSPNIEQLFGLRPDDVAGDASPLLALTHPADAQRVLESIDESARTLAPWNPQYRVNHPARGERWVEGHTTPQVHPAGGIVWYGYVHDITDRKRAEESLRASEERYRAVFESANDGVFLHRIVRREGHTEFILADLNQKGCEFWGYSREELLFGSFDLLTGNDPAFSFDELTRRNRLAASGEPQLFEWELRRRDGTSIRGEVNLRCIRIGEEEFLLAVIRDLSERQNMEGELRAREREFRTMAENSPDVIIRYDSALRRTFVNRRYLEVSGLSRSEALGSSLTERTSLPSDVAHSLRTLLGEVKARRLPGELEFAMTDAAGEKRVFTLRAVPEFDDAGEVASVLAVARDITQIDEFRSDIQRLAFRDPLTGLTNRHLLSQRMGLLLDDAGRTNRTLGLLLLDLDRFKNVNDTFGHPAGDELLRQIARRLQTCIRESDAVARLGGDEFAILLPPIRAARDLGLVARKLIRAFEAPFVVQNKELVVSVSVGISVFPDDAQNAEDLMKYADTALYYAKSSGRNTYRFYSAGLTADVSLRLALEADLHKCIPRRELETYFQPKIDLDTGTIVGVEALIRWNHGTRGLLSPGNFISIAEDTGQIGNLGKWVLRDACQTMVRWNTSFGRNLSVAINLSSRQFAGDTLLKTIEKILIATGCCPRWLEFEITESLLLDDQGTAKETLKRLREMGCTIAIDDFGTGYSALGYLTDFPIDTVKIDRSFVKEIGEKPTKLVLVKAIVNLARDLNMKVVAEGVETPDQAALLKGLNCHLAQGFYFGKPIPSSELERVFLLPLHALTGS